MRAVYRARVIPTPTISEQRILLGATAPARLQRFRRAVGGGDRAAVELYLLDARIASHLHATVRLVETALREHLHRAFADQHGDRWFIAIRSSLDVEVRDQIDKAMSTVGERAPAGKVVAQLMLGTWVSLLGRGGRTPDGSRAAYPSTLWEPTLSATFSESTRSDVHRLAMRLSWARNRIHHCEPVVFGFPQPGVAGQGRQLRRSPRLIREDARELTSRFNPRLGAWLASWNEADPYLAHPLADAALTLMAGDPRVSIER